MLERTDRARPRGPFSQAEGLGARALLQVMSRQKVSPNYIQRFLGMTPGEQAIYLHTQEIAELAAQKSGVVDVPTN